MLELDYLCHRAEFPTSPGVPGRIDGTQDLVRRPCLCAIGKLPSIPHCSRHTNIVWTSCHGRLYVPKPIAPPAGPIRGVDTRPACNALACLIRFVVKTSVVWITQSDEAPKDRQSDRSWPVNGMYWAACHHFIIFEALIELAWPYSGSQTNRFHATDYSRLSADERCCGSLFGP